ncbi:helix-turn-helix transcriptional regulator [Pantoea sp. SIMBA_079]|uniref:helix-turn-helix transcriptional regulator n=1 Tax=Pantoea TaxID=53335 RepID=UPI00080F57E1|nr:helix-turn-helix transcriptional regulator [Pantoea eucrina]
MADSLFFDELMVWIKSNITQRLLLQEVASKSGFSLWYLQRIFKKHTGITLGLYIRKAQMESARLDIITNSNSISDIAIKYGYESQQSFTRAFSRHYGMPPAAYRKVQALF